MSFTFTVRDGITPELARMARAISDKKPILEAMGTELVSITSRAFSDPSLRAKPWPPRKGTEFGVFTTAGGQKRQTVTRNGVREHNLLRKSGALWHSIRITQTTGDSVTVGSDRVYAAIQQFGSAKKSGRGSGIPARPFFPFASSESPMTAAAQEKIRKVALDKIKVIIGAT